jgi:bacillithiol biosynthesis cysteine-adding enzyme BshC
LFYDYVYEFQEVARFFPFNFRDNASFDLILKQGESRNLNRTALSSILMRQNQAFGCNERTLEHVAMLEKPSTFAVVTGQQVTLFGGPLYTIFKTITAIKLAERLKAKYPHYEFVPVFWLEGEDHDFQEMNHVSVIDSEGKPVRITYLHGGVPAEANLGPVGELAFDATISSTVSELESTLQKSEFTERLLSEVRRWYAPGTTFLRAFVSWMNHLFEDFGLVFISSNDQEVKHLLAPLFEKEIAGFPRTSQLMIARSAELEENYHAQIKPRSVNLLLFHKGGRYPIEPRENDFSLKGTRHYLAPEDLRAIARNSPELLSPNVVLRPIAQDALLPTVAYVGGPSEIAYSAQLRPVYEYFEVPQPVVFPRASGSFIEERVERVMQKYDLDLLQLFEDPESVYRQVLQRVAETDVDALFGSATTGVADLIGQLKFGLKEIDPTLLGPLEGTKSKVEGALAALKEKAFAAQKRRNETAIRQIERATNTLLPYGNLQEREISILYYMNKYGPELVKWLSSELEIYGFKHQVISL